MQKCFNYQEEYQRFEFDYQIRGTGGHGPTNYYNNEISNAQSDGDNQVC